MARITVFGGTGYAGGHIVREAVSRGHDVTAVSRNIPSEQIEGVTYVAADVQDSSAFASLVEGADVVIGALAPRGPLEGKLEGIVAELAEAARVAGARFGIVGGAGSLLVAPEGPAFVDTPEFSDDYKPEARTMVSILGELRASDESLDWFMVSPAGDFGPWVEGEHTGTFRLGGDVILTDENGKSAISGADFAQAFVDEIEQPAHRRARFTVAY